MLRSVAVFDTAGEMRWSSETTTGPDLIHLVEQTLDGGRPTRATPVKCACSRATCPSIFSGCATMPTAWSAIVAIVCRASGNADGDSRSFSLVHSLLRPALECLRRDLLARAAITDLNRTVMRSTKISSCC